MIGLIVEFSLSSQIAEAGRSEGLLLIQVKNNVEFEMVIEIILTALING
jgi:hypothetical protein